MILDRITDKALVFGLGGALVLSVGLHVTQAVKLHNRSVTIATMDKQINDPETGYVTRLGTCRGNVETLSSAIADQNAASARIAARSAESLAEATLSVAEAQRETAQAQQDANAILEIQPQGENACERLEDLDAQLVGTIK